VRRLGPLAFAALAAATVAAFFVTQHLKVADPLYNGLPRPDPAVIAPAGNGCGGQYRSARLSFYLQLRSDNVAVSIVSADGAVVRTLTHSRHMRKGIRSPFPWNGRTDSGQAAPDGQYYWRVTFIGQGRTLELPRPVTVRDTPPRPRVVSVTPRTLSVPGSAVIRFTGNEGRVVGVQIYRVAASGAVRLASQFRASGAGRARWNGRLRGHPATPGTYLAGLTVTDRACNTGRFPATLRVGRPNSGSESVTQAEITVGVGGIR
jgi:hypothetical protein